MGDPGQAFRDPHFWVRFTEMVFAIIAFSVIAEGAGYSRWGGGCPGVCGAAASGPCKSSE